MRAKIAASLEGKLETDACTAHLEFVHDANGAPGTAMAEGETFAAGTYWVLVNGLLGDAAQNYTLASDGAASFTVAASDGAGDAGAGTGSNAGGADKNGKDNKSDQGKSSGGKLADTGDGSGIAAGLAAAAVATTVAGAAMLANDRENAGDDSD